MSAGRRWMAVCAATAIATGGLAAPVDAGAAPVRAGHGCVSKKVFFHAIPAKDRKHIQYRHDPSRAVHGIRCTKHWAVASVTAVDDHGHPEFGYEVLEHLSAGRWHVVSRAKACEAGRVPRKLYQEVCESD